MRRFLPLLALCIASICFPLAAQHSNLPSDPAFREALSAGHDALQAGKDKDALELFKKANKLANNACAECYLGSSVAYIRLGQLQEALDSCDKAFNYATEPSVKSTALVMKGKALMTIPPVDAKRLSQAEEAFRGAIKLDDKQPVVHLNLAILLLREKKDDEAKTQLEKCLALNPPPDMKAQAEKLLGRPELARSEVVPNFKFTDLQGQEISLQDLHGKIVVLDFWATWCGPCRESVGELRDLTKKYPTEKVVLISISADEDETKWKDFVAKKKMTWPQYRDSDKKIRSAYNVQEFPTYMVIDGDGVLKQRISGLDEQHTVAYRLKQTLATMPQLEGGQGK